MTEMLKFIQTKAVAMRRSAKKLLRWNFLQKYLTAKRSTTCNLIK